jgi:hypothetical protein
MFPLYAEGGRLIAPDGSILLGDYTEESFTLTPVDELVDDAVAMDGDGATGETVPGDADDLGESGARDAGTATDGADGETANADADESATREDDQGLEAVPVVYHRTVSVAGSWGSCGPTRTAFYAPEVPLQTGVSYAMGLGPDPPDAVIASDDATVPPGLGPSPETFIASDDAAVPLATAEDVRFFVFSEHSAGTSYNLDVFAQTTAGVPVLVTAVGDHTKMITRAGDDPPRGLPLGDGDCAELAAYALDGSVIASERRCDYDAAYDRSVDDSFVVSSCELNATGRSWEFWQAVMADQPQPSNGDMAADDGTPDTDSIPTATSTGNDDAEVVELQAVGKDSDGAQGCGVNPATRVGSGWAAVWWGLFVSACFRSRRRSGRSMSSADKKR